MSGRTERDGSPGLLPSSVRAVALFALAATFAGSVVVALQTAAQEVSRGQFADSSSGAMSYLVAVLIRAVTGPPLKYLLLAVVLGFALLLVLGLVVGLLNATLGLGLFGGARADRGGAGDGGDGR